MLTYLPYIVIPILLVALPILLARYIDQAFVYRAAPQGRPSIFKVSGWMYGVLLFFVLFVACFAVAGFIYAPAGNLFLVLLGLFFVLLGLFEIWRLSATMIEITSGYLIFTKGKRKTVVDMSQIRSVVTANGLIIIDTGTIPRTTLPMYFRGASHLVAVLRASACAPST